jgi:hypothetical protein
MGSMKRRMRLPISFLFVVCISLPAFAADPAKTLRADLTRIFSDSRLADAQLGVEIFSLDRSEVLYEKNMVPG